MSDIEKGMSEADTAALIELTTEVVAAYVMKNHVRATELPELIVTVYASLGSMGKAPEAASEPAKLVPLDSIKKSVTDDDIISFEDGKQHQSTKRHLAKDGLTMADYRAKWGLPKDYPMVSAACSRNRLALADETGLGSRRGSR